MFLRLMKYFFFLVVLSPLTICSVLSQTDDVDVETGGLAICKIVGGQERISGNFKVNENFVILNNFERELEVGLEGESESPSGERSLESEVEVSDVDSDTFEINKILKTNASEAELTVELEEGDKGIAIVSLNQDENRNPVVSPVKLLLTKIAKDKVSGITQVTFPRTVIIPLDSPVFAAIENAEEGTEVDLQDAAIENGSVVLKCRFKNIPFTLIRG